VPIETRPVYGEVRAAGETYRIVSGGTSGTSHQTELDTGLTYKSDRYNTAGKLDVTVLSETDIPEEVDAEVYLRDTLVFRGTIRNSKPGISLRIRLNCYDAVADLKRNTLSGTYNRASITEITEAALAEAGVTGQVDLPQVRVSPSFDETRCDKVLKKVARWGDAAWWVSAGNEVVVTENIAAETERHEAELIRDASPGKRTPTYQSVRVIGSSPVSRRGLGYRYMISSSPIVATAGTGTPRFTLRDNDIQTQEQAQKAADAIHKRLQAQQKSGWIELVGNESIRPFDTVQMPETLGGEEYLVSAIKHTLDSRSGFVTRCNLGGLIET
jgi:hypothetical protein